MPKPSFLYSNSRYRNKQLDMPAIPNSEMGETKIHKIALHQLEEKGRKLIEYAQEHPLQFGLISITIVAGVAIITVPLALGFSSTGPVAGK